MCEETDGVMGRDKNKGARGKAQPVGSAVLHRSAWAGGAAAGASMLTGFSSLLAADDGADGALPSELAVAQRKLYKTSAVTRLKGLDEIAAFATAHCSGSSDSDDTPEMEECADAVLRVLAQAFPRLTTDPERQVRERACTVLGTVVAQSRGAQRRLGRHVGDLLPPWLCAMSDPAADVAAAAQRAFCVVPPAGRARAMAAAHRATVDYVGDLLGCALRGAPPACQQPQPPQPPLDAAATADFVERGVAAGLGALAALVAAAATADPARGVACAAAFFGGDAPVLAWPALLRHRVGACRRAAYAALADLADLRLPALFAPPAIPGDGGECSDGECEARREMHGAVLRAVGDRDPATHAAMWRAVDAWLALFGDAAWAALAPPAERAVFPGLWALLRASCYGSVDTSYAQLPRFLARVPRAHSTQPAFARRWLDALWAGVFQSTTTPGMLGVVTANGCKCIAECLLFWYTHSSSNSSEGKNEDEKDEDEMTEILDDCLVSLVAALLYDVRAAHSKSTLRDVAAVHAQLPAAVRARVTPRVLALGTAALARAAPATPPPHACNAHLNSDLLSPRRAADVLCALVAPAPAAAAALRAPVHALLAAGDADAADAGQTLARTFGVALDVHRDLAPLLAARPAGPDAAARLARLHDTLVAAARGTSSDGEGDWDAVLALAAPHPAVLQGLRRDPAYPRGHVVLRAVVLQCFDTLGTGTGASAEDVRALAELAEEIAAGTPALSLGTDSADRSAALAHLVATACAALEAINSNGDDGSATDTRAGVACALLAGCAQRNDAPQEAADRALATLLFCAGGNDGRVRCRAAAEAALARVRVAAVRHSLVARAAAQPYATTAAMAASLQALAALATRSGCWDELADMAAARFREVVAPYCRATAAPLLPAVWSRCTIAYLLPASHQEEEQQQQESNSGDNEVAAVAVLAVALAAADRDFEAHAELVAAAFVVAALYDCPLPAGLVRDAAYYGQQVCDGVLAPLLAQCPQVHDRVWALLLARTDAGACGVLAAHAAELLPPRSACGRARLAALLAAPDPAAAVLASDSACYRAQALVAANATPDDAAAAAPLAAAAIAAATGAYEAEETDVLVRARALAVLRVLVETRALVPDADGALLRAACAALGSTRTAVLAAVLVLFVQSAGAPVPQDAAARAALVHYCDATMADPARDYYVRSTALRIAHTLLAHTGTDTDAAFVRMCAARVVEALAGFDTDAVPRPGLGFYAETLCALFAALWARGADVFVEAATARHSDLVDCLLVARVPAVQLACARTVAHVLARAARGLDTLDATTVAPARDAPRCLRLAADALAMTRVAGCTPLAHVLLWHIVHAVFAATPRAWAPAFVELVRASAAFPEHMRVLGTLLPAVPPPHCYPPTDPLLLGEGPSDDADVVRALAAETETPRAVMARVAAWELLEALRWFPTLVRGWAVTCGDRALGEQVRAWVGAAQRRLAALAFADGSGRLATRVEMDDVAVLECSVALPAAYPLAPLAVDTRRAATGGSLSEGLWRRWHLLLHTMLSNGEECGLRDAHFIADTVARWHESVVHHFEGVEPCPVCYAIFSPDGRLPSMTCRTCHHRYHASCMAKWFSTSHKTVCPMCKSDFSLRA